MNMLKPSLHRKLSRVILNLHYPFSQQPYSNFYDLLDVRSGASFKQVREKYLLKSKQYHPDFNPHSTQTYQRIQQAYRVLNNAESRKRYDLSMGIRYSDWEREKVGANFKPDFQSGVYEQILKESNEKKSRTFESIQQTLAKLHKKQIQDFKVWQSWKIWGIFMGFSVFWGLWTTLETFLLYYRGQVTHQVEFRETQKTLKVLPLLGR